ncbi:carbohydrate sulfotransferase 11-like [Ptychodera flava]|uniref:carbohydrate sulfotransferase 11-like n=1 Tax=Ptychodera flava TaxID=63121 RepID=UPI00396A72A8
MSTRKFASLKGANSFLNMHRRRSWTLAVCLLAVGGVAIMKYLGIVTLTVRRTGPLRELHAESEERRVENVEKTLPKVEVKEGMSKIQERRLRTIFNVCEEHKNDENSKIYHRPTIMDSNGVFYDDEYKMLFCLAPRTGASIVKNRLSSSKGRMAVKGREVQKGQFFTMKRLSLEQKQKRWRSYTTFLFVRHPFHRILSAYRNKFEPPGSNSYMRNYGRRIIARYRPNAAVESIRSGRTPSFQEFVQYLLDPLNQNDFDGHWDFMHKLCAVCEHAYHFVGHFENIEEEMDYLLSSMAGKEHFHSPHDDHMNDTTKTDVYLKYFSQLPEEDIIRLYKLYKMDFEMFGYSLPLELLNVGIKNFIP